MRAAAFDFRFRGQSGHGLRTALAAPDLLFGTDANVL
jgi:hypothetical protein